MLKQTALAAALFAASTVQSAAESVTVAIANFGEHPQLSALADGFKDELSTLGAANDLSVSFTEDHVLAFRKAPIAVGNIIARASY